MYSIGFNYGLIGYGVQLQVLDPQTLRIAKPECFFRGAEEAEYDEALVKRMLDGHWLDVGFGCLTVKYILQYETSQTFVLALTVSFPVLLHELLTSSQRS